MPKLDGYEVTERLRQHEPTSAIPIILLTARVQDSDVARGIEAGADDYVKKPFSTADLRTRVSGGPRPVAIPEAPHGLDEGLLGPRLGELLAQVADVELCACA